MMVDKNAMISDFLKSTPFNSINLDAAYKIPEEMK